MSGTKRKFLGSFGFTEPTRSRNFDPVPDNIWRQNFWKSWPYFYKTICNLIKDFRSAFSKMGTTFEIIRHCNNYCSSCFNQHYLRITRVYFICCLMARSSKFSFSIPLHHNDFCKSLIINKRSLLFLYAIIFAVSAIIFAVIWIPVQ